MIMATEGRPRKLHRRDWPGFLTHLMPASVWQALFRIIPPHDDPRIRWTPKYILLAYIGLGWSPQRCLIDRFQESREWIIGMFPRRRRPGGSYVGLTKAGQLYGVSLFQQCWACLRKTIPKRLGEAWSWYGWQVFGVDGSRDQTARTQANEKALGQAGRDKSHPQWWMTWLVHLPTLLLWDWRQGPGTSSERQHMREMIPALPASALLVGDIGFGGFDFLWDLIQSGVHFLIRCGSNTTLLVEGAISGIESVGDARFVYLWPTDRRSKVPLKLRLIALKRRGKRVYLLTNVFKPARLSRAMAGDFYKARWGLEVNYRSFKRTMERVKVLAKTPQRGALELAGNILAMGLLRLHAALMMGAKMSQLSVASALRVIRRAMEAVRFGFSTRWLVSALKGATMDDYRRRRSKRARDWPHKKNESLPRPPKLRSLTKRNITFIQARINAYDDQNS